MLGVQTAAAPSASALPMPSFAIPQTSKPAAAPAAPPPAAGEYSNMVAVPEAQTGSAAISDPEGVSLCPGQAVYQVNFPVSEVDTQVPFFSEPLLSSPRPFD